MRRYNVRRVRLGCRPGLLQVHLRRGEAASHCAFARKVQEVLDCGRDRRSYHRIGNRDGVSRAFDILTTPSSVYRHHLKAYRDSYRGGVKKAAGKKEELAVRNQNILKRASELHAKRMAKHNIASILAREFDLSSTRIRQILKKIEILRTTFSFRVPT